MTDDDDDELDGFDYDDDDVGERPQMCNFCNGEGGWHDCGDDTCMCEDMELNVMCPECNGTGEL